MQPLDITKGQHTVFSICTVLLQNIVKDWRLTKGDCHRLCSRSCWRLESSFQRLGACYIKLLALTPTMKAILQTPKGCRIVTRAVTSLLTSLSLLSPVLTPCLSPSLVSPKTYRKLPPLTTNTHEPHLPTSAFTTVPTNPYVLATPNLPLLKLVHVC